MYYVTGGMQVYSVTGSMQVHYVTGCMQAYSVTGGMQVHYVTGGMHVYSVAGGVRVQMYSVTNYSTCYFLLHLQQFKNYIKELSLDSLSIKPTLATDKQTNRQTDDNCDLVI